MNIIYHGKNIDIEDILNTYEIKLSNNDVFKQVDTINNLVVDYDYYKKKDKVYIYNQLEIALNNNFSKYKKNIILLNIKDQIIQKFIKNNLLKLSERNKIIIITRDIHNIIDELRNSFYIKYNSKGVSKYEYEPLNILVDESYNIYKNDMEPLRIETIKKIKDISYKICKYDIPIDRYIYELLNKFICDPCYTSGIKYKIIKVMADIEHKIHKSYRILIHIENMLITIYDEIITFYQ